MYTNSRQPNSKAFNWQATLTVFIVIAVVAGAGAPRSSLAQAGNTAMPAIGSALYLLTGPPACQAPDLPPGWTLHAQLQTSAGAGLIVSGPAAMAAALAQPGCTATQLAADTAGSRYYLVDATAAEALPLAQTVGEVLVTAGDLLLVATTPAREAELLNTLPSHGVAIALLGSVPQHDELRAALPASRGAELALDPPNPAIAALLPLLKESDLRSLTDQLSGQVPVTVNGAPVTLNTRHTLTSRIRSAETFVYQWYAGLGIPVSYFSWTYGSYSGRNVIAEVRGAIDPSQILLLGGHLDNTSQIPYTTAPGADDNGTGTAATLLIARILRSYAPAITVRFVHFTGEEQGQWGSRVYANTLRQRGENVIGFINLDMIGWDGNSDRVAEIHTASGPKSNALGTEFLNRNDRYQQELIFERKTTTASRFSDHSPFWDNNYGAFLIIENFFDDAIVRDRNPYYHNTGDLPFRVNYNYVARIGRVALATVAELARYTIGGPLPTATPTLAPTPTRTPTPTATPAPGTCTNLLLNGGFEAAGSWRFGSTPFPAAYVTSPVYAGLRALRLGIPSGSANRLAHSTAYQAITIPAAAPAPVILRYVQRAGGASDGYDYRETLLLNADYSYLARMERSYATGNDQWSVRQFDLTAYRGRTVVLYFNVYNNGSVTQQWTYVDNVQLGPCPAGVVAATTGAIPSKNEPIAVTGAASLSVAPAHLLLDGVGASTQAAFTVTGERAGQPIAWQAEADAPWLQLTAGGGETPGTINITLAAALLPAGSHTARIYVHDALGAEAPQIVTVEVVQRTGAQVYLPLLTQK